MYPLIAKRNVIYDSYFHRPQDLFFKSRCHTTIALFFKIKRGSKQKSALGRDRRTLTLDVHNHLHDQQFCSDSGFQARAKGTVFVDTNSKNSFSRLR